eukprot:3379824-Rhodomonas_salina.3
MAQVTYTLVRFELGSLSVDCARQNRAHHTPCENRESGHAEAIKTKRRLAATISACWCAQFEEERRRPAS